MDQLQNMISHINYVDESSIVIQQYSGIQQIDCHSEIQFINKWIMEPSVLPLMIVGKSDSGKKTLLYQLIEGISKKNKNWHCISHFSSMTPIYSDILYRIMAQLRNIYQIEQRVDINEQKLRRYFKYWLQMVSDHIEKQYLGYSKQEVPKLVLIIQGVDQCRDFKGNNIQQKFWIPRQIPKNVKLILSTKSIVEEQRMHFNILQHSYSHSQLNKIIKSFKPKIQALALKDQFNTFNLHELSIINQMLSQSPDLEIQEKSFSQILKNYIGIIQNSQLTLEEIKSLLYILSLTKKGLKSKWIENIVNISQKKWEIFVKYFSFYVLNLQGYFLISNNKSKSIIQKLIDPCQEKAKTYRNWIVKVIRNETSSLRQLQEIVHHLIENELLYELKEIICKVQNFVYLYSPFSKNLLCQCWMKLQQVQLYDPVFQYNKAIQSFKSHSYPKEEDLYRLIFQVCMFFKEYSEFQNSKTPVFRHPLIKGQKQQLVQVGIQQELNNLMMIGSIKTYKNKNSLKNKQAKESENVQKLQNNSQNFVSQVQLKQDPKTLVRTSKKQKVQINTHDNSQQSQKDMKKQGACQMQPNNQNLNVQQINVATLANQQKFKNSFILSIQQYLKVYFYPHKKKNKEKNFSFEYEQSDNEDEASKDKNDKQFKFNVQKHKKSLQIKSFSDYLQDNYHQSGQQLQYYYYKQWLWLQFPWLCQSIKYLYSQMIEQCHPGTIKFMCPRKQFNLIKKIIKITKNAKQDQMNVFAQRRIEILPVNKYSKANREALRIEKQYQNQSTMKNSIIKAVQEQKTLFEISNIDQILLEQKQIGAKYNKRLRGNKSGSSLLFVTQSTRKQQRQTVNLPKIYQNLYTSKASVRNSKENMNDSRDYTNMIRKYNQIKHQNDILIQKIQQLKKLESIQQSQKKSQQKKIEERITNLNTKKSKLQNQLKDQMDLKKKLQIIIKICDINKMYGSQSESLNLYLSNIKEMKRLQQNNTDEIKERLQNKIQSCKTYMKQLKNRKTVLNGESSLSNSKMFALPLEDIQQQMIQSRAITRTKSNKQKSTKNSSFKQPYQGRILEEKMQIIYGSNQNEQKIENFLQKVLKKKELLLKNFQSKKLHEKKVKDLEKYQNQMKNLQQGQSNSKSLDTSCLLIEKKRQLLQMKARKNLLSNSIGALSTQGSY